MAYTGHRQLTGNAVEHVPLALLRNRTASNRRFRFAHGYVDGAASPCRKADRLFPPTAGSAKAGRVRRGGAPHNRPMQRTGGGNGIFRFASRYVASR